MITKQTVAVIGADRSMAAALTKQLAKGNYKLLLYYNEPESLNGLLHEILQQHPAADVEAIACSVNACWEADFIILDLPAGAAAEVADKIRTVANQKIVISLDRSFYDSDRTAHVSDRTEVNGQQAGGAELLQELLPHSKLVKVFSGSFGYQNHQSAAAENQVMLLAGNHKDALKTVFGLFSIAGMEPVVAGALQASRRAEPQYSDAF